MTVAQTEEYIDRLILDKKKPAQEPKPQAEIPCRKSGTCASF